MNTINDELETRTERAPKVSIGMPIYNAEHFLRRALDSLLNQTFEEFELIISDNASSDDTPTICKDYANKDSRIRYFRQDSNIGVHANLQFVLDKASGQYFMWAAHDDEWDPRYIEKLAMLLDKDFTVAIAFCHLQHVTVDGVIFREYLRIGDLEIQDAPRSVREFFLRNSFQRYLAQNLIHGKVNLIYGLIRREVLCQSDPVRAWGNFGWGADLLMVAAILRYGNVKFSPLVLWRKTENPNGEGSLRNRILRPTLPESLLGAIQTLKNYMRYACALWVVQGDVAGLSRIATLERMLFTIFEILRSFFAFSRQAVMAIARRIRGAV